MLHCNVPPPSRAPFPDGSESQIRFHKLKQHPNPVMFTIRTPCASGISVLHPKELGRGSRLDHSADSRKLASGVSRAGRPCKFPADARTSAPRRTEPRISAPPRAGPGSARRGRCSPGAGAGWSGGLSGFRRRSRRTGLNQTPRAWFPGSSSQGCCCHRRAAPPRRPPPPPPARQLFPPSALTSTGASSFWAPSLWQPPCLCAAGLGPFCWISWFSSSRPPSGTVSTPCRLCCPCQRFSCRALIKRPLLRQPGILAAANTSCRHLRKWGLVLKLENSVTSLLPHLSPCGPPAPVVPSPTWTTYLTSGR